MLQLSCPICFKFIFLQIRVLYHNSLLAFILPIKFAFPPFIFGFPWFKSHFHYLFLFQLIIFHFNHLIIFYYCLIGLNKLIGANHQKNNFPHRSCSIDRLLTIFFCVLAVLRSNLLILAYFLVFIGQSEQFGVIFSL